MSHDVPAPDELYTAAQRSLQDEFGSRKLADRLEAAIVTRTLEDHQARFIASRDSFYVATVTAEGEPTVSYKGGDVGVVTVVDPGTLLFPIYDGNGMFLSAGNMADTNKVGLLFIDHETPQRLRVQGSVALSTDPHDLAHYPGALLTCSVSIIGVFPNCARYVHKYTKVATSPYVPDDNGDQPLPSWKRIDAMQDVLPADDVERTAEAGGPITAEEYGAKLMAGES